MILKKRRQLLDEAGWVDSNGDGTRDKDGVELVLRYITNQRELRKSVQAVVQQQWQQVGIGAELVNYSSDIFWNRYNDGGPRLWASMKLPSIQACRMLIPTRTLTRLRARKLSTRTIRMAPMIRDIAIRRLMSCLNSKLPVSIL